MANNKRKVCKLASLDKWQLEHEEQDLRGLTLVTSDGETAGRIDDMLVNLDEERVCALLLDDNRVIDVDYVDIRDGRPVLLVPDSSVPPAPRDFDRDSLTTEHIPVVEERLDIGKREVELGRVRVHNRIVEDRVSEDVPLREEHVRVERRDLDQEVDAADADDLLQDRTIEVTETGEQVVVGKKAFVTGEVTVDKDVDSRTERVDETVRHTEVDVDRKPNRR